MRKKKLIQPVVIVANGKYPSHPYPLDIIKNAKTLISTDGSANKLKKHGYDPTFVIGDMDSITNIKDFNNQNFCIFQNKTILILKRFLTIALIQC